MPRANNSGNLTPNAKRTPEELRKNGAKGGRASGEARRQKKLTQQLARQVLSMQTKPSRKALKALQAMGYDAEEEGAPSVEMMGLCAVARLYMSGDLSAGKFLYDYAHIPDMRAQMERERMEADAKARSEAPARDDPLAALLARIDAEARP